MQADDQPATITIAAAGDLHCSEPRADQVERAFAELGPEVDLVLLAGDLTSTGERSEAAVLARVCAAVDAPVYAVLGNHDWHGGRREELLAVLSEAGVVVLERRAAIDSVRGVDVGIVGTKGFVGGFAGSHLSNFGEPSLRSVFAETSAEVDALDRGLREVERCSIRIVLLHYSPVADTLAGERRELWAFLGTDRLAVPIARHQPDLVLHGHAHLGRAQGWVASTPVYNVSVPVIGRDFRRLVLKTPVSPVQPVR